MNSIRAQNAIIDLLRGVVNDVEMISYKSTADPTLVDSDSEDDHNENEIAGGSPAVEAIENIFLQGGNPTVATERNEFADIAAKLSSQQDVKGGDVEQVEETNDNNNEEDSSEHSNDDNNEEESVEEANEEETKEEVVADAIANDNIIEEEVNEVDELEPDDMDGKEPIDKDDEGDKIEDNFESDPDNDEEEDKEEVNEYEMKGGAHIQRVNMITADLKFPFILKSRHK